MLAVEKLKSGSILCGGVGSGKSRTALMFYYTKECGGTFKYSERNKVYLVDRIMTNPKDLYVITTAKKRDSLDWEKECIPFLISRNSDLNPGNMNFVVDSWNNIHKYTDVENAFFIFDEQRVVGSGEWVKSFLKITKHNRWILLSATPGDTWMDYVPVFIANGFYKNRSEFIRRHVVYSRYTKYPKVDRYLEVPHLIRLKDSVLVNINYIRKTERHYETIVVSYNIDIYQKAKRTRQNQETNKPFKNVSEMCMYERKIVNTDQSRIHAVEELINEHPRSIIFYNYDYELDILRNIGKRFNVETKEWNGHKHESVPDTPKWIYLVQYSAGSEAWNCTTTNTIIFYSLNYSYKIMEQSRGRIDRRDTPYRDLYYYTLRSDAAIDIAIDRCLKRKQNFNENRYIGF